jgi:hypothetical protein
MPGKEPSKLDKFDLEALRYYNLEKWIARRILRKYGERDKGAIGPLWIAGKNDPQYFNGERAE